MCPRGATIIGRIGDISDSPRNRGVAVQLARRAKQRAHLRTVTDRAAQMPGVRGHIRGHVIMEGLLVCWVRSGDSALRLVAFCVTHRFEPVEQLGIMFAAADGDIRQIAGPCGERGHGSAEFRGIGSFDRSDRQRAHRAVLRGEEKVEGCGTGGPADRDDQHIRAILSHERAAAAGDLARDFSRYRERDYRNRGVGVIRVGKRIRGYGHVQADQAVCPADRR